MAKASNASVATGATLNQDVVVGGSEWLSVIGIIGTAANAAGVAGDVSIAVLPYLDHDVNPTLVPATLGLPTTDSAAAVLASSRAWVFARYRVAGIRKVQIRVMNNNVASKPAEADFSLG
jgi:hypothetical protein